MIRYQVTHPELLAKIAALDLLNQRKKDWPKRAKEALKKFRKNPNSKIPSLWSEIKPVYAVLQYGKCAFCERLLGADEIAAYEQDVEHFRPKKGVLSWPPPDPIGSLPFPTDFPPTNGSGNGYRKLPFHELNYVVACKTCNTRCKGNYFPVRLKHRFAESDPTQLRKIEEPYLIFPLGDWDDDPETIITFMSYTAIAAKPVAETYNHDRARICISFFLLNDPSRQDQLLLERACRIDLVGSKIEDFERSPKSKKTMSWNAVLLEGSPGLPHSNCVRSLIRLYFQKPVEAHRHIALARIFREQVLPKWNGP